MNPAGAQVLTTLLLAKECGVKVDDDTLLGALRFFYRFAGKGTVPYGDHRGEGALGSNGKDGMIAAAMQIACSSSGNTAIYEKARQHLALSMMTSYSGLVVGHGDNGRGDAIWRSLVTHYMKDHLWGTEADLAFHSIDHNPKYYDHGTDEPTHVPYWTFGSAYWTPKWDPKIHTREKMLKNVRHRRYMIRAQAAKAMLVMGMRDELEPLLNDPDPRVRRAGIDGLIDYRYWFGMGKNPVRTEEFTPGMLKAVRRMLSDPKESWPGSRTPCRKARSRAGCVRPRVPGMSCRPPRSAWSVSRELRWRWPR